MDKVQRFLGGDGQVMLILGDSGAGKSTFNRHLEYVLWKRYQIGDRIPLFINLPALERPEKELVSEQLRIFNFSDEMICELKQHGKFTLISNSSPTSTPPTSSIKLDNGTPSCLLLADQYLGPDYRHRFVPKAVGQYRRAADDLFQEAVIAPFSMDQIEVYVKQYVPLEPRTWVKKDYMDKLTTIPNLMDLVKNPFLLTLALKVLPTVVRGHMDRMMTTHNSTGSDMISTISNTTDLKNFEFINDFALEKYLRDARGKSDLSKLQITRVQLYDTFVEHWLGVNKRRLQDQRLSRNDQRTFDDLLADGFEVQGIAFQKDLAAAIFKEQEGKPVVDYIPNRDKASWKTAFLSSESETVLLRGASLLSRVGAQYRFVHRSVLEYFYSRTIYEPAEFDPHAHLGSTDTQ
ncbi:hypothetical protein BGX33_001224 [Mortierella sp. NVP41]|nr:hypothetical protein BGX33_001224 [Mortierella sp. NVP41]